MESALLIGLVAAVSGILIFSFFYVIKKGYSKKWDEDEEI